MRRTKQQPHAHEVYDILPYRDATAENTFFCMVIADGGAYPYLRTGDELENIGEREFADLLTKARPGCIRYSDIPYLDREEVFTLRVEPYKFADQVLSDRRTGQLYREIMWCWGHAACGDTILIPVSADEVRKLRKKR